MMNRTILAALITLETLGLSITDHRLERELRKPGLTPTATINALGSLHIQSFAMEVKLIAACKGWAARIEKMADTEIAANWPTVTERYLAMAAFLQMKSQLPQEAA